MRYFAIMAAWLLFFTPTLADVAISDAEISRLIVGSWIPEQDTQRHAMITYNADGSGEIDFYSDASCSAVTKSVGFVWTVSKGQIAVRTLFGDYSYDAVISIDAKQMVTQDGESSAGPAGGTIRRHVRATDCSHRLS
jgi:hypothetical protein